MRLTRSLGLATALALAFTAFAAPPAQAQKKERIELKFGTLAPDNTPWSDILKNFKKSLQKSTRGQIRVKNYLNGVLGDEAAMLQKIKFGQLTGGGFTSGGLSTVVPEMQVLEIPYLFNDNIEADFVMDEIVKEDFKKLCAERGLHLYIWAVNGWHDFGSTDGQLVAPSEFNDVKAFMQETESAKTLWKSLGANPVPLAVPDVLNGLQRGMVTAYSTTPIYATASQWFTQTKHWTDSSHMYQPAAVVFDLKWWNGLEQETRDTINKFADDLQASARQDVRGIDADLMEEFRANGITVHTLSDEQRAALKQQTAGVAQKLIDEGVFPQELYDKIQAALAERRANAGQ